MFLSRDAFDLSAADEKGGTPATYQAQQLGAPSPAAPASRPQSSYGRPQSAQSLDNNSAAEGSELQSTPMTAETLKHKMMQQRQAMLKRQQQQRSSQSTGQSLVMANKDSMGACETSAPGKMGGSLSTSRPSTGMSLGRSTTGSFSTSTTTASESMENFENPSVQTTASRSNSMLSTASMAERDVTSIVMPAAEAGDTAEKKAEEGKRRTHLAQELEDRGICPVFDPAPDAGPSTESTFNMASLAPAELKPFLLNPTPKTAGMIQCRITRECSGLNKFFPKYKVESEHGTFLMTAKKQTKNKTSNYVITMSKTDTSKDAATFLGKLRSDFLGLGFTAYSDGMNPKKVDPKMPHGHAMQLVRQELVAVQYSSSLWGTKPRGPRKMSVVIPHVQPNGERLVCRTLNPESEGLLAMEKEGRHGELVACFENKSPKWNDQIGAFVLNFNKRVTQASVKNFQLISKDDPDTVYLQFGRVGKDIFNMDFRYPFSAFQAFAICLSSFDYKLCCE